MTTTITEMRAYARQLRKRGTGERDRIIAAQIDVWANLLERDRSSKMRGGGMPDLGPLTDEKLEEGLSKMSKVTDEAVLKYMKEVFGTTPETTDIDDEYNPFVENARDALDMGLDWPLDLRAIQLARECQRKSTS